ncbi:DUF2029 domain-containing protein [Thalassoroseus pseudoceratinae]|uniref:DUF2029 domain-containing protein n=1 Tax=Thalassoroseus pseudoceratinae TaxID=2713176 RepID=UPI0014238E60|nr:DUF2029 domain-containing protein [Thalassoroseus pseudoceratinae]
MNAPSAKRPLFWFVICVTAGLGMAAILNVDPLLSANDRSRWATVWSLSERGTYQIDEIIQNDDWDTIDKVRHDGHFYSSKPPLLPTIVAGVYEAIRATTGWNLTDDTDRAARSVLVIVNLLPLLIGLTVLSRFITRYMESEVTWAAVFLSAAFGTYLSTFSVTLNNHTPAAISVIFVLAALSRIVIDGSRSPGYFIVAGLFAAFACTCELPAALFGVATFLLLVKHDWLRTLLCFVPAALIPLAAFFVTNYLVTGGVKPFYAYYGTETYEYIHQGVPSYWMFPRGIDANTESTAVYFMHCVIGHHGILSLTPIFLFGWLGWFLPKTWKSPLRILHGLGALLTVAILAFYMSRTANYNYGGNTAGLRWAFWLIPFWLVGMIPVLDAWGQRRWFQFVVGVCLSISVYSMASAIGNPWRPSWLFDLMKQAEWIDYDAPAPKFERPLTTWIHSLPPDPTQKSWVEFESSDVDGTITTLRLTDGGRIQYANHDARTIIVDWNRGSADQRRETYYILEERFHAGRPPREFLVWPGGQAPSKAAQESARTFFRNMPKARGYNADHIRYLKTPLREDAIRCQQAASRVRFEPNDSSQAYWYRSDVWISDQVPFGCLRFETTVRVDGSNEPYRYRRFDITAASWLGDDPPYTDKTVRQK